MNNNRLLLLVLTMTLCLNANPAFADLLETELGGVIGFYKGDIGTIVSVSKVEKERAGFCLKHFVIIPTGFSKRPLTVSLGGGLKLNTAGQFDKFGWGMNLILYGTANMAYDQGYFAPALESSFHITSGKTSFNLGFLTYPLKNRFEGVLSMSYLF